MGHCSPSGQIVARLSGSVCTLWLCGSCNIMPGSSLFPTIDDLLKERLKCVF